MLHLETTPKTAAVMEEESDPSCDAYGVEDSLQRHEDRCVRGDLKAFSRASVRPGQKRDLQRPHPQQPELPTGTVAVGQDCNTQSLAGVYTNTVVLQHHNVVLTKADKMYNVRCTYETTSRNVSFGMIPVRDPATLEVSGAPEAPLPQIVILGRDGREASTVRIGDRLTFHIEIPEDTPYGIFASCFAILKTEEVLSKLLTKRTQMTFRFINDKIRSAGSNAKDKCIQD
ncbi:hypothetical protein CEXT_798681 [Caerostris extrusa]|uniref:Uncharacterized protein n=1 Tax=Caerostris extrusa TaxID=172846 RepID=A0AAV4RCP2_CAEEX|nr:hypothetical protein CEXT_798681 [Caerostris extrusa]